MVGFRADAANPVGDVGHVFRHPADTKLLEAAQFWHLEIGVGHFTFFIQEDIDLAMAFKASDWIDGNSFHNMLSLSGLYGRFAIAGFECRPAQLPMSHAEAVEGARWIGDAFLDNPIDLIRILGIDD